MARAATLLTAAVAAFAAALAPVQAAVGVQPAQAAAEVTVATGHDVSYPQCGRTLPQRGDIAVVGVNAGTGVTTNPCLSAQLAWGDAPASDGSQRLADVYVNTANPGQLGGWWPSADLTRAGLSIANPQGSCVGAEDAACAYVYGWSIAADDALRRGVTRPGDRTWWLDVETMNTWSWNRAANRAVLEGMTDALHAVGASVGIYSTTRQWDLIAGAAAQSSVLAGLPSWVAGAITRGGAEAHCSVAPFTPGGRVVMAQWVEHRQDHNVACQPGVTGSTPAIVGDAVPGETLVAAPGTWGPDGVHLAYRWLRDGVPIDGATSPAYTPGAADVGADVTVEVRGSRAGAPSLALRSEPVVVRAADPIPTAPTSDGPASSRSAEATVAV